jgi:hypothetical protein
MWASGRVEHMPQRRHMAGARTGKSGGRALSTASECEDGAEGRRGVARRTGGVEASPATFVPLWRDKTSGVRAPLLEEGHDSGEVTTSPRTVRKWTGVPKPCRAKREKQWGFSRGKQNVLE